MTRKPFVAGQFYPGAVPGASGKARAPHGPRGRKGKAIAVVAPHAGYVYSGAVAGAVFSSVAIPDTILILGPAHRPIGPVFASRAKDHGRRRSARSR